MEENTPHKILAIKAIDFGFKTFFKSPIFIVGAVCLFVADFLYRYMFLIVGKRTLYNYFPKIKLIMFERIHNAEYLTLIKAVLSEAFSNVGMLAISLISLFLVYIVLAPLYYFIIYWFARVSLDFYDGVGLSARSYFDISNKIIKYFIATFIYYALAFFMISISFFSAVRLTGYPFFVIISILIIFFGIYMVFKVWLYPFFIIDQDTGAFESLKKSFGVRAGFVNVLSLFLLMLAINIVGQIIMSPLPWFMGGPIYSFFYSVTHIVMIIAGAYLYRMLVSNR